MQHRANGSSGISSSRLHKHILGLLERTYQQGVEAQATGQTHVGCAIGHPQHRALYRFLQARGDGSPHGSRNGGAVIELPFPIKLRSEATRAHWVRIEKASIQARPFMAAENLLE